MKIEDEYNSILTMIPDWKTEERKRTLKYTIGTLLSNEPTIEELLTNDLDINKPTLLELTLNNMKNETIKYAKFTKRKNDYTEETLKDELQELISKDINAENMEEIQAKQDELGIFKKKNYQILEDERPTRRFLAMESR